MTDALRAALEHALELAEQYHSGHSVAGSPCGCVQCRELRVVRRVARAALAASPEPAEGLDVATESEIRYLLWTLHGHDGKYGDDGEMQCAQCGHLDYRRDPLAKITAYLTSLPASLSRLQQQPEPAAMRGEQE